MALRAIPKHLTSEGRAYVCACGQAFAGPAPLAEHYAAEHLPKPMDVVPDMIRRNPGQAYVSDDQRRDLVELIEAGALVREAAEAVGMTENTARAWLKQFGGATKMRRRAALSTGAS